VSARDEEELERLLRLEELLRSAREELYALPVDVEDCLDSIAEWRKGCFGDPAATASPSAVAVEEDRDDYDDMCDLDQQLWDRDRYGG
jgi:hypothetical protein